MIEQTDLAGRFHAACAGLDSRTLANILPIPGTSSLEHFRENLQASELHPPAEVLAVLNSIAKPGKEF